MTQVATDTLAFGAVEPHLAGSFGRPYSYAQEVESTQQVLLGSGLGEGAVAVAEHQTAGRGRLGRPWSAPPGTALLVSLLLEPPAGRKLPELSLVAAVATAAAVETATGLSTQIKWPNDVMLNRRKVAGILAEVSGPTVVVGIGINVNQAREELPSDATVPAGSLRSLTGSVYDRAALLGSLLTLLEQAYDRWRADGLDGVYDDLGSRDFLRGRRITVDGEPATAHLVLRDGRLEIEMDSGEKRVLESGEVRYTE